VEGGRVVVMGSWQVEAGREEIHSSSGSSGFMGLPLWARARA
jgi:hypothetical protein